MSRFGFVALAGRPNTGKSTLLNTLAGRKLAIVSPVPQTTRHVARLVITHGDAQLAFCDLPGYGKPKTLLGQRLNEAVDASLKGTDAAVFMVDASAGVGRGDTFLARRLANMGIPTVACVNKIDVAKPKQVAEALAALDSISKELEQKGFRPFVDFVPISAKTGLGVDVLLQAVASCVPEGPHLFPESYEELVENPEQMRILIAEVIREKLITGARDELPYSIAVLVEDVEIKGTEESPLAYISGKVVVERPSQKAIVIGAGGSALKEAGTKARQELEVLLGMRVYLDLKVVVEKDWQRDPKALQRLGL